MPTPSLIGAALIALVALAGIWALLWLNLKEREAWERFKRSFVQSNYITDFWTWLLTLLSKSAELVLFGSILYSSYQLIPGVPAVPPGIDAFLFLVQQAALDIGGMGLLKLAKRAGLSRDAFPMRVGITLVVLMIANVVLATVKHALPMVPAGVYVAVETLLLIARAIMAVLFGHAIHALREEYGDSTITIKDANELRAQIEDLSAQLAQAKGKGEERLTTETARLQQSFAREREHWQAHFQQQLAEALATLRTSFQQELAHELSPLHGGLQLSQETLAQIPDLQARMQQMESSTVQELHSVKVTLEKTQRQIIAVPSANIRALPPPQKRGKANVRPVATADSRRAFVEACLRENAGLKLAQIVQRAQAEGYELSEATISRYRTQFFQQHRESPTIVESESPSVPSANAHESSSDDESPSDESEAM